MYRKPTQAVAQSFGMFNFSVQLKIPIELKLFR